jgi:glucose-6-phosphate-specific signal transduction histidine kinase
MVPHNINYANMMRDEVSALEQVGHPCGLAKSPFVYLIPHFLQERWYVHLYLSTFGNHEFKWSLNPII